MVVTPKHSAQTAPHSSNVPVQEFAKYASRTRSDAKCSSRSNSSSAGAGGSGIIGLNTAGRSGGSGASNWGGISSNGSCLTCRD